MLWELVISGPEVSAHANDKARMLVAILFALAQLTAHVIVSGLLLCREFAVEDGWSLLSLYIV